MSKLSSIRRWLLALGWTLAVLVGMPAMAQEPQHGGRGAHGQESKSTLTMKDEEFFLGQFEHLMPHEVNQNLRPELSPDPAINQWFRFYNVNLWQLIALALIVLVFSLVKASFARAQVDPVTRVFRGFVQWIRDDLVFPIMGKEDGGKFLPYFCYLFFFIAFMNVLGLVPVYGVTATATFWVTGTMALTTFAIMLVGGMRQQGVVGFFKHLIPPGLPAGVIPLIAVVELIGLFVKPFALMVRLFANMLAGHLVLYSFIGLIFLFAKLMNMGVLAYAVAVPTWAMAVLIYVLEAFVALLQAYVFTLLSITFVQQALHPAH